MLDVDQSALTGESLAVSKAKSDMLFSGSIIKSGESDGLVVLTGNKTYFGKTTELVQIARPRLHSEDVISQIVTWLLVIVGVALAVAFVVSALAGEKIVNYCSPYTCASGLFHSCRIACNVHDNYGDRVDGPCKTRRAGDTTECS